MMIMVCSEQKKYPWLLSQRTCCFKTDKKIGELSEGKNIAVRLEQII